MKKSIETKKIFVAALILSITLIISPLSSFGGGALVCPNEENIVGLVFDFDPPLPVTLLEGYPEVIVTSAVVLPISGREMAVLNPSGQYNYHAILWGGTISAYYGKKKPVFQLEFESATLDEHFTIPGEIPVDPDCDYVLLEVEPDDDVDLFFKVKEATLIDNKGNVVSEPFDIMLKLKHSDLQIIMFKP